jgi:hypothetical protein
MHQSPLSLLFLRKLLKSRNPVRASIALEVEEKLILITRVRTQLVNMKSHLLRGHNEFEDPI